MAGVEGGDDEAEHLARRSFDTSLVTQQGEAGAPSVAKHACASLTRAAAADAAAAAEPSPLPPSAGEHAQLTSAVPAPPHTLSQLSEQKQEAEHLLAAALPTIAARSQPLLPTLAAVPAPAAAPTGQAVDDDDGSQHASSASQREGLAAAGSSGTEVSAGSSPSPLCKARRARSRRGAAALAGAPLKATPAGARLVKSAPNVAVATVREAVEQLGAGVDVYKRWSHGSARKLERAKKCGGGCCSSSRGGSLRLVQAGMVDGKVLVEYRSGIMRTPCTAELKG